MMTSHEPWEILVALYKIVEVAQNLLVLTILIALLTFIVVMALVALVSTDLEDEYLGGHP